MKPSLFDHYHDQPMKLLINSNSYNIAPILLRIFLLLALSCIPLSQFVVNTLPGFPGDLPFKLETGYIGVGELEEVQLFYYFVESERSPKDDPLMLWLTGGPGCSSLSAILYEIGPFAFDYAKSGGNRPVLKLNPYSWTKWLMDHPMFLNNPLYIGGDSYCGIVVPIIVQEIYNGNEVGNEPPMNIKGYVLGNPFTDKIGDLNSRAPFAHRASLLSDELYESTKSNCMEADPNNALCINDLQLVEQCTVKIFTPSVLEPRCSTLSPKPNLLKWDQSTLDEDPRDLIRRLPLLGGPWCRDYNYLYSYIWANDKTVQKALHVREVTINEWVRCNPNREFPEAKSYTFNVNSSVEFHRNLTNKLCRALIYSGDHDMVIPYVGTVQWINSLALTVEDSWAPWFVDAQVAGYTEKFSHNRYYLTFATVKGGGHTAPEYKPKQCLAMIRRWFAFFPL